MSSHYLPRPQAHFLDSISRSNHSDHFRAILISVGKLSATRRIAFKAAPSTTQQLGNVIKEQGSFLSALPLYCTSIISGILLATVTDFVFRHGRWRAHQDSCRNTVFLTSEYILRKGNEGFKDRSPPAAVHPGLPSCLPSDPSWVLVELLVFRYWQ